MNSDLSQEHRLNAGTTMKMPFEKVTAEQFDVLAMSISVRPSS